MAKIRVEVVMLDAPMTGMHPVVSTDGWIVVRSEVPSASSIDHGTTCTKSAVGKPSGIAVHNSRERGVWADRSTPGQHGDQFDDSTGFYAA